jgi:hypothetical protein
MASEEWFKVCLESLLNQDTTEPYQIVLNIPFKYNNYPDATIPQWLQEFVNTRSNKIKILRDNNDYGPISNLLYPMKHLPNNPNDIFIVVDDDQEYHPSMISYHLKKLKQYSHRHVICYRGNGIIEARTWYENGKKWAKMYNTHVHFPTKKDIYVRLPDHWHSVSYPRHLLGNDMFDEKFLSITWNNDQLMGYYGWTHDFYFLCAEWDAETDYRPVNHDGRGAYSFPVLRTLPNINESGCYFWRFPGDKLQRTFPNAEEMNKIHEEKPIMEWFV